MANSRFGDLDRIAIIDDALKQLPQLLDYLGLSIASKTSQGFSVGLGNGSLHITTSGPNAGLWNDFGGSYTAFGREITGGDLVHLFAAFSGGHETYGYGLRALNDFLGGHSENRPSRPVVRKPRMHKPLQAADKSKMEIMRNIVEQSTSISGTLGEIYLRNRGIDLDDKSVRTSVFPALQDLRFHPDTRFYYKGSSGNTCHKGPALLLIGRDVEDGEPTNIQQIFLNSDGVGKLALSDKNGKSVAMKRSLCPFRNAFRLPAPDGPANELILTEGPENALSLRIATNMQVWACFGNSNLSKLDIPNGVSHLSIISDGDHENAPAEKVFRDLAFRYRCLGYHVRLVSLRDDDTKMDANDFLQAQGPQALADRISETQFEPPYPVMTLEEGQAALNDAVKNILADLVPRVQSLVCARQDAKVIELPDPAALKLELSNAGTEMHAYLKAHADGISCARLDAAVNVAEEICKVIRHFKITKKFRPASVSGKISEHLAHLDNLICADSETGSNDEEEITAIIQDALKPFRATLKEILPSTPAMQARSRRAHAARMEQSGLPQNPAVSLILGTPGLGKTRSLQTIIRALGTNAIVWVLQPTLQKAEEFEHETRNVIDLPIVVVRGRSAVHPSGTMMCARGEFADRLSASGRQIGQTICRRTKDEEEILCPHYNNCLYIAQQEALKGHKGGGVFVMSHAALTMPNAAPKPDLVVVDEDPSFSLVREVNIDASRFDPNADWRKCVEEAAEAQDAQEEPQETQPSPISSENVAELFDVIDIMREAFGSSDPLRSVASQTTHQALHSGARTLRLVEEKQINPIRPDMPDQKIKDIIRELDEQEVKKIGRILRSARDELKALMRQDRNLEDVRLVFNGINLDRNAVSKVNGRMERLARVGAYFLADNKITKSTPIIVLDGTADPELLSRALNRDVKNHRIDVERMGEAIHVYGKSFSTRSLVYEEEATPRGTRKKEVSKLKQQLISLIEAEVAKSQTGVFVCSTLRVEDEFMTDARREAWAAAEKNIEWAHFGNTRGINKWQDCSTVILVGRKLPPATAVLNLARAFYALDPEPFDDPEDPDKNSKYTRCPRTLFDKQGNKQSVDIDMATDLRINRILWQTRDAESIQALDRVRAVRKYRRIILLGDLDLRRLDDPEDAPGLGLPVDTFFRWSEVSAGETRVERILNSCHGFLPLAPLPLYNLAKGEFRTLEAAKKWLQRTDILGDGANTCKTLYALPALTRLKVRPAGYRGTGYRLLLNTSMYPSLEAAQRRFEEIMGDEIAVWNVDTITEPASAPAIGPPLPEEMPKKRTGQVLSLEAFQQRRNNVEAQRDIQAAPLPAVKKASVAGSALRLHALQRPAINPIQEIDAISEIARQMEKQRATQMRREIEVLERVFREYAQADETDPDMWG